MGLGRGIFKAVTKEAISNAPTIKRGKGSIVGDLGTTTTEPIVQPIVQPISALDQHALDYNKSVARFKRTYRDALQRGSISDRQLLKLSQDVKDMDEYSSLARNLMYDGATFTGKGMTEFEVPRDFFDPNHYRKPVIDLTPDMTEAELRASFDATPPKAMDIGKGFADLNNPGLQDDVRVSENAIDPAMGADYRTGASNTSKDAAQAQSIHNSVSSIKKTLTGIPESSVSLTQEVQERIIMGKGFLDGKVGTYLSRTDHLGALMGDNVAASQITSNAQHGIYTNMMSYKRTVQEQGSLLLDELNRTLDKVIKASMFSSSNKYKASKETSDKVNRDLTEHLLHNAQEFSQGLPLSKSLDPVIQQLTDIYHKSGFAKYMHKKLSDAGHEPDMLNPSRIPSNFLFENVSRAEEAGKLTREEFYDFMGSQIVNGHPALSKLKIDRRILGRIFYNKLEHANANGGNKVFQPLKTVANEAEQLSEGTAKDIDKALNQLFINDGALSPSFKWDFKRKYIGQSGQPVTIVDFLDSDVIGSLTRQMERVSGVYGMAQSGFTVAATLDELGADIVESFKDLNAEAIKNKLFTDYQVPVNSEARLNRYLAQFKEGISDSQKLAEMTKVFENTVHHLMGRAVGESLPAVLTAASSLAAMTKLVGSGVLNIVDQGKMYMSLGALNVLGTTFATIPSGKMWRYIGGKLTIDEAKESLAMMLALQKSKDVRMLNINNFFNNPAYHDNRFLATTAYMAQGTPLANMSEFIRRQQLFIVAQLLDKEMVKLSKGAKGNKSLHARLSASGLPDDVIRKWGEAINKFGRDTSTWPAEYKPNRFESEMSSLMDNIITKVKVGETPTWFADSSVAKAVLPFMAVQFALTNTLLRNTANQGVRASLELLAYQAPFALAAVYLREIIAGKNPEDLTTKQLIFSYLSVLPTLGSFSILANLAYQSEGGRGAQMSSLGLTYVNDVAKLGDNVLRGNADISDFAKVIPLLSINPALRYTVNEIVKP